MLQTFKGFLILLSCHPEIFNKIIIWICGRSEILIFLYLHQLYYFFKVLANSYFTLIITFWEVDLLLSVYWPYEILLLSMIHILCLFFPWDAYFSFRVAFVYWGYESISYIANIFVCLGPFFKKLVYFEKEGDRKSTCA